MTITNTDLDQLDALAEAATPGPWADSAYDGGWDCVRAVDHHGPVIARLGLNEPSNSAFIAASRLAIPALVAEARRLRGVVPTAGPALGASIRDLTVADLDALPVGSRIEDVNDPEDDRAWGAFTKTASGQWSSPGLKRRKSAELREFWTASYFDYRLAHLPTEETTR